MKPENFASKIGALEAIVEDLRVQMQAEAARTCQWAETGDSTGIFACATCRQEYAYKVDQRPACPHGR